jgi:ribosomal RNA-processing protein 12
MDAVSDGHTIGGKTFATWATNFTDCTNATFSRVLRYSDSALHKEVVNMDLFVIKGFILHFPLQILAVLAAITEIIKEKDGKETETEYFAALMTALETMEGEETILAVAYLLSLVIRRYNCCLKNWNILAFNIKTLGFPKQF